MSEVRWYENLPNRVQAIQYDGSDESGNVIFAFTQW